MSKCPVALIGGYDGHEVHHVFARQEVSPAFDLFTHFDLYTREGVWYRIAKVNVAGFLEGRKTFPRGSLPAGRPLDGRLDDHLSKLLREWVQWHQGNDDHLMLVDHHGLCLTIHVDDLSEYTLLSEIERLKYDRNVICYKEAIHLTVGERYFLRSLNSPVVGVYQADDAVKPSPYWVKTYHYGYAITDEGHRLAEWIYGKPSTV